MQIWRLGGKNTANFSGARSVRRLSSGKGILNDIWYSQWLSVSLGVLFDSELTCQRALEALLCCGKLATTMYLVANSLF